MRLLVVTSAMPPVAGGAESYIDTVTIGLASRGHEVVVATDGVPGGETMPAGRKILKLKEYHRLIQDPSKLAWEQMAFGLLPELERRLDVLPEVVFCNSLEATILGRIVAAEHRIPLVAAFHEHSPEAEPFGVGKSSMVYEWLRPDAVVAGSRYYEARALRYMPRDAVHLVSHGIDVARFSPPPDRRKAASGAYSVATVGRLKERKGHLELVRAMARLPDDVSLTIAGTLSSASPSYAARIDSEIKSSGLADRVKIVGDVTPANVDQFLSSADLVVLPSHSEGLGLTLLESMAMGIPVVCTDIDGFNEVLGADPDVDPDDLVVRVTPGSTQELADAIAHVRSHQSLAPRMAALARSHVVAHFSTERMVMQTEEVLRGCIRLATARQ